MKRRLITITTTIAVCAAVVLLMRAVQVSATHVYINSNLTVSPSIISFETVFPGEVFFEPLNVSLSQSFLTSGVYDYVEYRILQKVKPKKDHPYLRAYCQKYPTNYRYCYPSLCPYLSKEPDSDLPNDRGVPAFHNPLATSSIALGRLSKSEGDTRDQWTIDLHTPCFRGNCDQSRDTPSGFTIDPRLHGKKFGCDLVIEVIRKGPSIPREYNWRSGGRGGMSLR